MADVDPFELGSIAPTAVVSDGAELGRNVTVGPFTVVHSGVSLGDDSVVGSHCVLGEPTADFLGQGHDEPEPSIIGSRSVIRSHTVIYQGVAIGPQFRSGHHVSIREGSVIGEDVQVGTMSDLQGDLRIDDHVRLHSNVHVGRKSIIEQFVWIFPFVVLTNDPHPPSDTCTQGPTVREFAVVATNSVLMPAIEVGKHALVGAMSLVTRDVPPETVVVGAPAREMGSVRDVRCRHGALERVYPWPVQFRRGYPDGSLPPAAAFDDAAE